MSTGTIKWKVDPEPTGRYRSFDKRGWPTAWHPNGRPAAFIHCVDAYEPANVRTGTHGPLWITLCHHQHPNRGNSWVLQKLMTPAKTLTEAKTRVADFLRKHPEYLPLEPQA